MRNLKRWLALALLPILLGSVTGCTFSPASKEYTTYYYDYFDTFSSVTLYADDDAQAAEYEAAVASVLGFYHEQLHALETFDGVVNLCSVNEHAGDGPVVVSAALFQFLQYALNAYEESRHTVNIAIGAVTDLWRAAMENERIPDEADLAAAMKNTSASEVRLDEAALTVEIPAGYRLDAGALAKGYVAGKVRDDLLMLGCRNFMIALGGNICCMGAYQGQSDFSAPSGFSVQSGFSAQSGFLGAFRRPNGWTIAIANPDLESSQSYVTTTLARDESVVSSGDYERFVIYNGQRYHHIIDPATGWPANLFHSVSVKCADAAAADWLSTALFILPADEHAALLEKYDATAFYVYPDYSDSGEFGR